MFVVFFFNQMLFILKMDGTEKMENSPTDIRAATFPAKHERCSEENTGKVTLVSPQIPRHPSTLSDMHSSFLRNCCCFNQ